MPDDLEERVEMRRLLDWFNVKFFEEVTNWLVTEKVYKRLRLGQQRRRRAGHGRCCAPRAPISALTCAISAI